MSGQQVNIRAYGEIVTLLGASLVSMPWEPGLLIEVLFARLSHLYPLFDKFVQTYGFENLLFLQKGKVLTKRDVVAPESELVVVTANDGG